MSLVKAVTFILCGITAAASLTIAPAGAAAASPPPSTSLHLSSGKSLGSIPAHPGPRPRPSVGPSSGAGNGHSMETMTLEPSNLMTSYQYYEADNDGPPYCGLHTNGTGPAQTGPGEILAGYSRYWDPGTQPFPCWEQLDQMYRGAVKFDLTPWFRDLIEPRKLLITAKLRFDVSFEDASNGWAAGCPSPVDLLQASTDWTGGTPDLIPGDELYNVAITDQHSNEIDVTSTVRRWMAYNDAGDNGFVVADLADESYLQQNVTCLVHVHNVGLVLQYLPLQG